MSENNSKKESNVKNKPQEQGEGKSGGFVGLLKDIIKLSSIRLLIYLSKSNVKITISKKVKI
jgi:hypothetical protein